MIDGENNEDGVAVLDSPPKNANTETNDVAESNQETTEEKAIENSLFNDQQQTDDAVDDAEPELIAGQFKTQEALIEAYKHQREIIKGRTNDMPDDVLREIAAEKGFINEPPENYENTADLMKEQGIEPFAEDAEEWDGFYNDIREAGFSQGQLETMIKIGGPWVNAQIAKLGPEVDMDKEQGELKEEWGDSYEKNEAAIAAFAQANLHSDLLYKPLAKSAIGHKLILELMNKEKGAKPITKTDRVVSTKDPMKLDNEISEIMGTEQYQNRSHPDNQTVNAKVDKMLQQLSRIRAAN